ncbi:hypothetical protein C5167_002330 [Papaver somniferum]|uniref:Protein phosphatase n=1 Tax=Papaver somniferum TaxID=3469 RepID=A0A4Y7L1Q6_PAPSO|nr:hypothetical protein C5167_002330 [Papaver somniferum]
MAVFSSWSTAQSQRVFLSFTSNSVDFISNSKSRKSICCSSSSSELNPVRLEVCFSVGTHLIPHPSKLKVAAVGIHKVEKGGEDAFLVSNFNGGVLAIADGVSGICNGTVLSFLYEHPFEYILIHALQLSIKLQLFRLSLRLNFRWAEKNVDPSFFPKELMANASYLIDKEEVEYEPQILLGRAHAATSSRGSATVIVAMLEKTGVLKIANVGDCGLRVLRKAPQEHYFDCPYQLSSEAISQTYLDAAVSNIDVMEGDKIIMGSDGLFDNVYDREIVSTISRINNVAEAAKALAVLANEHSRDANFDSPYSLEARDRGFDVPWWKKVIGRKLVGSWTISL